MGFKPSIEILGFPPSPLHFCVDLRTKRTSYFSGTLRWDTSAYLPHLHSVISGSPGFWGAVFRGRKYLRVFCSRRLCPKRKSCALSNQPPPSRASSRLIILPPCLSKRLEEMFRQIQSRGGWEVLLEKVQKGLAELGPLGGPRGFQKRQNCMFYPDPGHLLPQ